MKKTGTLFILFLLLPLIQECRHKAPGKAGKKSVTKELVIYCENGVLAPVLEISKQYEATHDVKIRIQNDCSQNLISLLQYTRDADIFIPDTRRALSKLQNVQPHIFSDTLFLGYNPMVFIVAKGNPLKFDGHFSSLLGRRMGIILANPETSSLGFETRQLLQTQSLFDSIMHNNVVALSADSRGLLKNVATGQASLTIDWLSSYLQNNNRFLVDTLQIPNSLSTPRIYAATLAKSPHPIMAQAFMDILNSELGAVIFKKYGIKKRQTLVF